MVSYFTLWWLLIDIPWLLLYITYEMNTEDKLKLMELNWYSPGSGHIFPAILLLRQDHNRFNFEYEAPSRLYQEKKNKNLIYSTGPVSLLHPTMPAVPERRITGLSPEVLPLSPGRGELPLASRPGAEGHQHRGLPQQAATTNEAAILLHQCWGKATATLGGSWQLLPGHKLGSDHLWLEAWGDGVWCCILNGPRAGLVTRQCYMLV